MKNISGHFIVIQIVIVLMALINFAKIAESDLLTYYNFYSRVDPFLGVLNFIAPINWGQFEPLWVLLVVIAKWFGLTSKTFHLIIFCLSYNFIFKALNIIGGKYQAFYIFASLYLFQPYLFSVSFHLFRQLFAISLLVYIIARMENSNKVLFFVPVFLHISSIIGILPNIKFQHIIFGLVIWILLYSFFPFLASSIIEKVDPHTTHDLGLLNSYELILYLIAGVMALFVLIIESNRALRMISKILIFLLLIVIIFNSSSELVKRLVFHFYILLPFLFISIQKRLRFNISKTLLPIMILFFIYHFVNINPWIYVFE